MKAYSMANAKPPASPKRPIEPADAKPMASPFPPIEPADAEPMAIPNPPIEPECECQDQDRCPVHYGYD